MACQTVAVCEGAYKKEMLAERAQAGHGMGSVIEIRHARASIGSRAAKPIKASAVKPASAARSVASKAAHHSAGILLRWPHLVTVVTGAPVSTANASRVGQSSTMALKDGKSVMPPSLGQSVLESKALLSSDNKSPLGHDVRMAKKIFTDFECRFLARTYAARKLKFENPGLLPPCFRMG